MIITDFYENCEIFITGGSGVVGRALIDKLLRSCNVKRIYILLRPKKGMDLEQRMEKIRKAKIFRVLRKTNIEALNKLTPIPGDCASPNIGITEEYMQMLQNVSCVFHCAATVLFNEPLKVALKLNVAGTLEALKFAMHLKKLKMFMHVSTFFSNPYLTYVEPKLYPPPMDWRHCMKLLESDLDDETFDTLTRKLIIGFPNTYTFTKNIAESLVNDFRDRLPISIYRPSVVLFAVEDPEPGFPPTIVGPMGLFALVGAGLVKSVLMRSNVRLDLTPQDLGIYSMLYYGPKSVEIYDEGIPNEVPIYMFSSAQVNPFPFKHMGETVEKENLWEKTAYTKSLLLPGATYTENRFIYTYLLVLGQILPAILVDLILRLMGRPPVLMGIARKVQMVVQVLAPFLTNEYDSPGVSLLEEMENACKGTEFDFLDNLSNAKHQWKLDENVTKMTYMIREVLLNEDPSTLPKARMILKM